MNSSENLIRPYRLRKLPKRFSWLDQSLVHDGHLSRLGGDAAKLYLFLLGVSDRHGLSYYSDGAIRKRIGLKEVSAARSELVAADLLAWRAPFYQLLSLPERSTASAREQRQRNTPEELEQISALFRRFREENA